MVTVIIKVTATAEIRIPLIARSLAKRGFSPYLMPVMMPAG